MTLFSVFFVATVLFVIELFVKFQLNWRDETEAAKMLFW